ncbi:ISL3 family transposase [Actinomarinicola tropica]|uniref:ISL3 family transposase n=1 Tax=Actinomarinicola tropica TaxID=2789776 RepID=A0A5Q2RIH4_9ACTN|nr:ISL3 family transposase [Actinomarinicola tropica]QGG96261.1 ISL3 family transposase [Actinomarinicola tropica]QGG96737.1 ISL3 family transposase [Actinomarinicola tropica]QGG96797.1 ISL3 family transposase [Actinomarinicola tropica]
MFNATRACELLVGLGAVKVLEVVEPLVGRLEITVESIVDAPVCPNCGERAWVKDRPVVELVDLTCFGRPVTLRWRKHRFCCPRRWCRQGSWTHEDPRIAAPRLSVTDRAGRWATRQVGRNGRAVSDVAAELGADWHAINDAVIAYGTALLDADQTRVGAVAALGVDEVLFARLGRWRTQAWSTSITDVTSGQLLDVIEGRSSAGLCAWLAAMPVTWRDAIAWAVLDLSGPWRLAFDTMLPDAGQVADPFHLIKLANQRLDEVRRRVQQDTLGHRGRKDDPLYRSRRLLTRADERLDDKGREKLLGLLDAGDPRGEVRTAWHAKETVRGIYDIDDPTVAAEFIDRLGHDLQDESCPPEVRQLGRTITKWRHQIAAWHRARVSNGPTEAINNLIKRVKRVAFGFRRFAHYRVRALLYAGRPNWALLATVTPR